MSCRRNVSSCDLIPRAMPASRDSSPHSRFRFAAALEKFALEHPVQAELVKLRYFTGLTNEEVSEVLGISVSTAKNYWTFSRAWLLNEIEGK